MNKKLYLSFLWHMHQPYYMDDESKKIGMPWVFLHCLKDYYDMPYYLKHYSNIKATFNLVPSLLEQINAYCNNTHQDKLLTIMQKEVATLSEYESEKLFEYLFLSHYDNMIKPLKRYNELYLKYQNHQTFQGIFSNEEILDLEVLFLLSWCGNYLRDTNGIIQELLKQGSHYTQAQKQSLFETLFAFLPTIITLYEELAQQGQIAVSTTPFYHPILPLLLDKNSAKEAKSEVILPKTHANFSDFASKQVQQAVAFYELQFGKKPRGFWPSEGSVSLQTLHLLAQNEVKWTCSDEEILYKTVFKSKQESLYSPYRVQLENSSSIDLFFRDKYLSDLIGFEYSSKEAKSAAQDFISHLHTIYLNANESALVNVILDGENAWEYYSNNASNFFYALYELLQKESWCETILFDDIPKCEDLHYKELLGIATGSWINANFDIWIGTHEKNQAWELLDKTKNDYDTFKHTLDEQTIIKIEKEFMVALGSDWFWWYGDDHYTALKSNFDKLFRKHLKNIYKLMKKEIPLEILTPIVQKKVMGQFHSKPTQTNQPIIDGRQSDFFEWLGAGHVDLKKDFSTMDTSSLAIEHFFYNHDEKQNLYFLFECKDLNALVHKASFHLMLNNQRIEFEIKKGVFTFEEFSVGIDECIEIQVNKVAQQQSVVMSFELFYEENKIQFAPMNKEIIFNFQPHSGANWYI